MDETTRLAVAARDGDREAATHFVRRSQDEVWRLCSHLGDRPHADDLTQETFLRAFRALPGFDERSSARTWLLAIARNVCSDDVRRRQRRRRVDNATTTPRTPTNAPDHAAEIALDALLMELEDDRRAAFVLTQVIGCSYAEAAEVCDVEIGTIRSRVARAREQLTVTLRRAAEG